MRSARYHWTLGVLHWVMVALLAWLIWGGLALAHLGFSPEAAAAYAQHKSIGTLALLILVVRLGLRLVLQGPGHEPSWRGVASLWVQRGLYALMLLYPLSGYFFHSATQGVKVPLVLMGWTIPDLSLGSAGFWQEVHHLCLPALILVLSVHIAGAAFHLIRRDSMFQRILPF